MLRRSWLAGVGIWIAVACGGERASTTGGTGEDAAVEEGDAAGASGATNNPNEDASSGVAGSAGTLGTDDAGNIGEDAAGGDAGDPNDGGSEAPTDAASDAATDSSAPTFCTPMDTQPCYEGDPSTEDVGECHGGTQTCMSDGSDWGPCVDQVLPVTESCSNGDDDDCDGATDESEDLDGDGWGNCDNDCCDIDEDCPDPELQNPGAYEIVSNGLDDDCDVATLDSAAPDPCSIGSDFSLVTALDLAQAMDLCQTTTASPALAQKKWGLISAQQLNADGTSPLQPRLDDIQNWQSALLTGYGTAVLPQAGDNMVGMSTGRMRDVGDAGYVAPNTGTDFMSDGLPPASYLAAHSGVLPASAGCSGNCPAGTGANDSVNLRLTIRVPTNVSAFRYRYRFFSSEYWTYSCQTFNDFSLALLTTTAPGIPADHNIAYDAAGNPVSVNNGLFEVCQAKGCYTCPLGTADLAGTGMDADDPIAGGTQQTGGGTAWLSVQAPVVPGETMVLDLMIFDVTDNILDSVLLLDDFEWVP